MIVQRVPYYPVSPVNILHLYNTVFKINEPILTHNYELKPTHIQISIVFT